MLGQLIDVVIVPELRVISMDSNDLVILFTLVYHLHDTNGLGTQERHWHNWSLHEDKHILQFESIEDTEVVAIAADGNSMPCNEGHMLMLGTAVLQSTAPYQRVVVLTQGLWDEAVVMRVHD